MTRRGRGYSASDVGSRILRRMPDYIHSHLSPIQPHRYQLKAALPTVDTSKPVHSAGTSLPD